MPKSFPLTAAQVNEYLATQADEYITTYSGQRWYLAAPTQDQIVLTDLAKAMSIEPRFNGQTHFPWPVGAHSILVYHYGLSKAAALGNEVSFDLSLGLLLHDAAEAVLKDITKPLKNILGPIYMELQRRNTEAIYKKFEVNLSPEEEQFIHDCDMEILLTEAMSLGMDDVLEWAPAKKYKPADIRPLRLKVDPVTHETVYTLWLKYVKHYL